MNYHIIIVGRSKGVVLCSANTGVKPTPAVSVFFNNRRCRLGVAGNTDLAGVARFMLLGISGGVGWSQQACPSVSVPAGEALRGFSALDRRCRSHVPS
eukprot:1710971-Pyramimonas_sp.AAC.1